MTVNSSVTTAWCHHPQDYNRSALPCGWHTLNGMLASWRFPSRGWLGSESLQTWPVREILNSIQSFEMSFTIMCLLPLCALSHKNTSWNEHQGHTWTLESLISLLPFPHFPRHLFPFDTLYNFLICYVYWCQSPLASLSPPWRQGSWLVSFTDGIRVPATVSGIL